MSEFSLPQQGLLVGDAIRAPYDADEWSIDYTASLLGFARRANYGVILGYDNGSNFSLEVTQTTVASNQVELKIGAAVVRGTLYLNDATLTLTVQPNASGNARIDTLVLRKDYPAQTVRAAIKQGTPGATPAPPTLVQTAIEWEIPIVDIAVANGFSTISDANITQRQEYVNVGNGVYVDHVLNNSGGDLVSGDAVIWDVTTARAVIKTTTPNDERAAGIWVGRTANGGYGRVQRQGFALVPLRVTTSSSFTFVPGTMVTTALQSGKVTIAVADDRVNGVDGSTAAARTANAPIPIGILMQPLTVNSTTFDDKALIYIDVQPQRNPLVVILFDRRTSGTDGGTFTSGAWQTRELNAYRVPSGINSGVSMVSTYVSVASNQFTLQPGVYRLRASAPAYQVNGHQARLQNITDGTTVEWGTTEYSPSAVDGSMSRSFIDVVFFVAAAKVFEIQHRCATTKATTGFGRAANFAAGVPLETYTEVEIFRLGYYQ